MQFDRETQTQTETRQHKTGDEDRTQWEANDKATVEKAVAQTIFTNVY